MSTTEPPNNDDDLNIDLKEAANAYETERQLNRLAMEIERYSPELLGLLAEAAEKRTNKSDFATRVHTWQDTFADSDDVR